MTSHAMTPVSHIATRGAGASAIRRRLALGSAVVLGIIPSMARRAVPDGHPASRAFHNCFQLHVNAVTTASYAAARSQISPSPAICTNAARGTFVGRLSGSSAACGNRRGSCRTAPGPIRWPRPWCGRSVRGSRRTERRRGWRFSRLRERQRLGACAPFSVRGGGRATCLPGYAQLGNPRGLSSGGRKISRPREDPASRRGSSGRRSGARSSAGIDRGTSCWR